MDYELEFDGKKIELPDSMVKPRVDLTELPDAKPKRVRKKKPAAFDLQQAVDALPPGGGTVHVPEGEWDLGAPVILPNAPVNVTGLQTMPPNLADYLNIHATTAAGTLGVTPSAPFDPNAFSWKDIIGGAVGMIGSAIVASMFKK